MKNTYLLSVRGMLSMLLVISVLSCQNDKTEIEKTREIHEEFLENSPFATTKNLSKEKRKELRLPPNAYNEHLWELTMNPRLGIPTPFLVDASTFQEGAPGTAATPWTERGPFDTAGRTRVVFFDLNDVGANNGDGVDYNRVFAGGVGGGLWVNDNILSPSSSWTIIPGIAGDLSVNCYAIDPNDPQTIYIGTGEQYSLGAAVGNGVYKSTDGGNTWNNVNITPAGPGNLSGPTSLFDAGIFFVNDIIVRDNNGSSEVYVGIGSTIYASPNSNISNPNNFLGAFNSGLYRSVNGGTSWNRIENPSMSYTFSGITAFVNPNDFEIGADNTLYFGSITTIGIGQGGGRIYSSTDGLNWSIEQIIPQTDRVELATSSSNANLIYVAAEGFGGADLYVTTDKFNTFNAINEPNDADNSISPTDFARNQAFYDLVIEVDPNNDQIVYAGGIDTFRSTNGGSSWSQISKWSQNPNLNTLNVPFVHADIHELIFRPGNSNQAVIGSDGGVSYASSLSIANSNPGAISNRNNGFNITQFYYGDISDTDVADGDDLAGGTQDNGSPLVNDASATGLNSFFDPIGGDGAYTAIDGSGNYAILSVTSATHFRVDWPIPAGFNINSLFASGRLYVINQGNGGDFINVAELDKNLDYFYANNRSFSGANSILQCELFQNSSNCIDLTNGLLNGSRPSAMKISPFTTGSSKLFLGTVNSRLIRVDNANTTSPVWTNISGPQFLGSVSDIEFGTTEQEIFVTMHNYGVQSIWYSNDGGTTWSGKEGNLPDIPVKAILKNPLLNEEVIIGTEEGIFVTGDFNSSSPNWIQTNNGMTSVRVVDLDLRASDNTILASTHGRGMFTGTFTTLGFDEVLSTNDQVRLFPSSNNGIFNLTSDVVLNDASIAIYNMSGQEIYREKMTLSDQEQRIDLNNPASGVYLVKIIDGTHDQTLKMIVN